MKKGFTLLELLLVVAILAILAAAIGPSFYERGQVSIEYARKSKFINNYNALNLAANVYLLGSDTTRPFRNNGAFEGIAPGVATGGLTLLAANNIIQVDTTTYENFKGETRYFTMAVYGNPAATVPEYGSSAVKLSDTKNPLTTFTAGNYTGSVEDYLRAGRTMADLWEEIKMH